MRTFLSNQQQTCDKYAISVTCLQLRNSASFLSSQVYSYRCAVLADLRGVLVLTGIGVVPHLRAGVRAGGSVLDRNTRVAERGHGAAVGERKADDPR